MAKIREPLKQPEAGWVRYDDSDSAIKYIGDWTVGTNLGYYNGKIHHSNKNGDKLLFSFSGNAFRIITFATTDRSENVEVKIDDIVIGNFDARTENQVFQCLIFEKHGLSNKTHQLEITNKATNGIWFSFDAIDIYPHMLALIKEGEKYLYYHNNKWEHIKNTNLSEEDFIEYGMTDICKIPESAWAELKGDIELCYYTDNPNKTEASFNIETEPFTLAEDFDDQTIKIIEYTDDPDQEDSTITLETEPFTFYDEVGDSFDVLYYTDDPDKTEAQLEMSQNYSPLDELDGDFELVTWTMEEEVEVQEELDSTFKEVFNGGDLYVATIDEVTLKVTGQ